MSTTHPEPTIYDRVEIETTDHCKMWRHEDGGECDNQARYVFVYEANSSPEDDRRRNNLACSECCPVPDSDL